MIWNIKTPYGTFHHKFDLLDYLEHSGMVCETWETQFSFSQQFDDHVFKRHVPFQWLELAEERFRQVRKKYDYVRLMYSGGKDSRFVLDLAEQLGFEFDEIFFYECVIFDNKEAKEVYVPQHYKDKKKFTHARIGVEDYKKVFKDPMWVRWVQAFNVNMPLWQYPLQKYIACLHNPKNYIDLMGGLTPIVWFDGIWKFRFTEGDLSQMTGPSVDNFMLCGELPELYNLYMSKIADSMESIGKKMDWSTTIKFLEQEPLKTNYFRETVPEFNIMQTQFQYPKKGDMLDIDHGTPWYQHNFQPKARIVLKKIKEQHQELYDLYTKQTRWDLVEKSEAFGSVMTKEYQLI